MDPRAPTISAFMTKDPCGVDHELTLADAADRMRANNIRHLLVVKDGRLQGLVSAADLQLAAALSEHSAAKTPVANATRPVYACAADTPLDEVVRTMEARHLECAVVIEPTADVVGIFTLTDALRAVRALIHGRAVEPEVVPTHVVDQPEEREKALHTARVRRMLASHGAAPSPNDGKVFGKVFPQQ